MSYAPENQPSPLRLALRHYLGQLRRDRARALPGVLLPGVGTIFVHYVPAFIIAKVIDLVSGLRVDDDAEDIGLDLSQHAEQAYAG